MPFNELNPWFGEEIKKQIYSSSNRPIDGARQKGLEEEGMQCKYVLTRIKI